jgi:transcriptional regulator GlxA family with amidase domain
MMGKAHPKTVVIVAFDGVQLLDAIGPSAVFAKLEQLRSGSYGLIMASPRGGEVVSSSGVVLARTLSLADLPSEIDTLLITGGEEADLRTAIFDQGLGEWVKTASTNIRRVGSICTGAFVLAAAGLLDGRRATTHWHSCDLLQQMCPAAKVEADVIYTVDPPIYTSAGVAAGIDLALALVEQDYGRAIAADVARELVLFVRRPGSQSQFSAGLAAQANAPDRLKDLITWIIEHPDADLSIAALAARVGMSERNFSRAFGKITGKTPARFVEETRFDHARDLLHNSDWPLDRVAQRAGFGSTDALNRSFRKRLGVTPAKCRDGSRREMSAF